MKIEKLLSEYLEWGRKEYEAKWKEFNKNSKKASKIWDKIHALKYDLGALRFYESQKKKELKEQIDSLYDKVCKIRTYSIFQHKIVGDYIVLDEFIPTIDGFLQWISDNKKL